MAAFMTFLFVSKHYVSGIYRDNSHQTSSALFVLQATIAVLSYPNIIITKPCNKAVGSRKSHVITLCLNTGSPQFATSNIYVGILSLRYSSSATVPLARTAGLGLRKGLPPS